MVCLKLFYGGHYDPHASLSVPVSLTRSGIPRTRHHRHLIAKGDARAAGQIVLLFLFLLYNYEVRKTIEKVNFPNKESLVSPDIDALVAFLGE